MITRVQKHIVTITSTVSRHWIEFCVDNTDLFGRGYCGYWLRGVESTKARGRLVWEDDDRHAPGEEPNRKEALRAWRKGEPLPKGWYRMDHAFALKAWGIGVLAFGEKWYDEGDAPRYDYVIQMALLGEERYG